MLLHFTSARLNRTIADMDYNRNDYETTQSGASDLRFPKTIKQAALHFVKTFPENIFLDGPALVDGTYSHE